MASVSSTCKLTHLVLFKFMQVLALVHEAFEVKGLYRIERKKVAQFSVSPELCIDTSSDGLQDLTRSAQAFLGAKRCVHCVDSRFT